MISIQNNTLFFWRFTIGGINATYVANHPQGQCAKVDQVTSNTEKVMGVGLNLLNISVGQTQAAWASVPNAEDGLVLSIWLKLGRFGPLGIGGIWKCKFANLVQSNYLSEEASPNNCIYSYPLRSRSTIFRYPHGAVFLWLKDGLCGVYAFFYACCDTINQRVYEY